jgi:protein-tyrosine-phosphatase
MAEAILKAEMPAGWEGTVEVASAGTAAMEGQPASAYAVEVLREMGIDLSRHSAKALTREMVEEADFVFAMTRRHRDVIYTIAPETDAEVLVLGELDSGRESPNISDPFGGERSEYERTRDELSGLIPRLIDYLIDIFNVNG